MSPLLGEIGRILMVAGAVLFLAGAFLSVFGTHLPLGRLPGDIVIRREHTIIYFPLTTSLLVSAALTLLLFLLQFLFRR
ncbi:MAG: hypothetical protein BLITH_1003 [Brockia lithotrophica]|uniref:DUF2905 family protein n=1 Tax=Brockia lithotrophica TaxID=933949 RepID=A0A2T5G768_9BACL|nr:MAG: hypothetical protein BLITH_1003 [Brockia lithotrophica]